MRRFLSNLPPRSFWLPVIPTLSDVTEILECGHKVDFYPKKKPAQRVTSLKGKEIRMIATQMQVPALGSMLFPQAGTSWLQTRKPYISQ